MLARGLVAPELVEIKAQEAYGAVQSEREGLEVRKQLEEE